MPSQAKGKAVRPTTKALLSRIERLEHRLAAELLVERRVSDSRTARNVQSIGVLVDYVAAKGLIDREDFKRHVERKFPTGDLYDLSAHTSPMLDIYGWLIWAESESRLRSIVDFKTDLEALGNGSV